ncbi:DUF4185 domain-containing protein [Streptomyces sp. 7N604]|uniref:DUF4185 domain-containing protein n=1 Tax=Streptomyces sp. 7N604 TaxID=3457415 RepID=UPI003FCEE72F
MGFSGIRSVTSQRHRTITLAALALALAAAAALLLALPGSPHDEATRCRGLKVGSWAADDRTTGEFARYGDDGSRFDDWTGGDGTHSVRLPDGRTLWLFSDPFLGQVHPPPNPEGQPHSWRDNSAPGGALGGTPGAPAWLRNAAVVMSPSGRLERTLTGGTAAAPAPLFPNPPSAGQQQWRWPVEAVVEPRTSGSPGAPSEKSEKSGSVVRVLLWTRTAGAPPWLYGVPAATEVATLSLPDLRLEGIERISDQTRTADPARRVLYGTTAVRSGRWTYVFGGDDGRGATPARPSSHAYLARVPHGRLADPSAWRYWDGGRWQPDPDRAAPVLGDGGRRGVGSAFTVVRKYGTWVLLTMDAGGPHAAGLATITSYWACSPRGPWHGPSGGFEAPLPPDSAARREVAAYNPQAHPEFTSGGRLLLSYDVNWLGSDPSAAHANVNRNVSLYRPRFVRLRLEPAGEQRPAPAPAREP